MASLKHIKAFAHNLADSYLSTIGWVDGDYKSTWLYRAALESGAKEIQLDIFKRHVRPEKLKHNGVLLRSLDGLSAQFHEMLQSAKIPSDEVVSLIFLCEFPELKADSLQLSCTAIATDKRGKAHRGKPISLKYPYQVLAP